MKVKRTSITVDDAFLCEEKHVTESNVLNTYLKAPP